MKKTLALALALAAAPFAASAGEISHTFVEAGLTRLDVNTSPLIGEDIEFDGGYLQGSVEFAENFYAFGGYSRATNDDYGFDFDADQSQIGVGYNQALSERVDFIAELSYVNVEVDSVEADGARAGLGVRGLLGERAEGWAKVNYTDGGDFDGATSGEIGVLFKFTQTWGLVTAAEFEEDAKRLSVGVRASF